MMNIRILLKLFRHITITTYEKGDIVIQKGETAKNLFFIRKGLIRSYATNEKMEEITFQLFPEYHIFGNIHSVLLNKPSNFCFEALERTKVYSIDYDDYYKVAIKHPELVELNQSFLGKRVLNQAFQRVEAFVFLSPEERYQKYVKDYPNVIGRAPDKYIANVLGITPGSLSRIRNRIASKAQ